MNRNRQEMITKVAATHRENIQRSLQHRLEVARSQGDEQLVRILEREANYYGSHS